MTRPGFSIIIPTHNCLSAKHFSIAHVIRSVLWQTVNDLEIIVVDDRGTDNTIDRLASLFPCIRIVRSELEINNLGHLRNLGAQEASRDLLLFVDDDTVLGCNNMLEQISDIMRNNDFCCGADRLWTSVSWHNYILSDQSAASVNRTLQDISFLPRGINRINGYRDLNEFTFIGNFGCVKTETFRANGGFDSDNFPGWGLEDTDLMMRLCLKGLNYVVLANKGPSVFHLSHPVDIRQDFVDNLKRFNQLETERGHFFHVNHFFGVYEGDGYSIFTKL
jgi:glycosyltransferase involved in cell wall biosynthesis